MAKYRVTAGPCLFQVPSSLNQKGKVPPGAPLRTLTLPVGSLFSFYNVTPASIYFNNQVTKVHMDHLIAESE